MPFEKIMNSIYEMWSKLMPERALACAFNLEYLLTGGLDARSPDKPIFMFYDWLPGGWGGRNGKDGSNVTTACFGTGLMSQPVEGQERANPILTTECEILKDSPGPGKWRGGAGVVKTSRMLQAEKTVISYICDRERARGVGHRGRLAVHAARPDVDAAPAATPKSGSARSSRMSRSAKAISSRARPPAAAGSAIRSNATRRS